jgi:hypothetical protein
VGITTITNRNTVNVNLSLDWQGKELKQKRENREQKEGKETVRGDPGRNEYKGTENGNDSLGSKKRRE